MNARAGRPARRRDCGVRGSRGRRSALPALMLAFLPILSPGAAAQQPEITPEQVRLLEAVRDGDVADILALAEEGVDLNQPFVAGLTPLSMAIMGDQVEVVEVLLSLGAEVTQEAEAAAMVAGSRGTEGAATIAGLLDDARLGLAGATPAEAGGTVPEGVRVDGPGTYSGQLFSGPCWVETTRGSQPSAPGVQEVSRYARTQFFLADQVPNFAPFAERRPGTPGTDLRAALQLLPVGSPSARSVNPSRCEPTRLGPGTYTKVVETHTLEQIWECSPRAGPDCGWWILNTSRMAVERSRTDGIVITAAAADREEEDEDVLRADAGGPYLSSLGAELTLDGSGSVGEIVRYSWTFERGADCPEDAPFRTGARKVGPSPSVVLLCHTEINLTVEDASGRTDRGTTTAAMVPRPWQLDVRHEPEDLIEHESEVVALIEGDSAVLRFPKGVNVAYPEQAPVENMLIHPWGRAVPSFPARPCSPPRPQHRSWQHHEELFEIAQVEDEGGPFDGFHYLASEPGLRVWRRTLLNQYLLPDGNPPGGHERNFFEYNAFDPRFEGRLAAILESTRRHEEEHTRLMAEAFADAEAMARIEELYSPDEEDLGHRIDCILQHAEHLAFRHTFELHDHAEWEQGEDISGFRFPVAGGPEGGYLIGQPRDEDPGG